MSSGFFAVAEELSHSHPPAAAAGLHLGAETVCLRALAPVEARALGLGSAEPARPQISCLLPRELRVLPGPLSPQLLYVFLIA